MLELFHLKSPSILAFIHLVIWGHGLLEHVLDEVVRVLGNKPVHPPQGGPGPVDEVHRDNRDLRPVILAELSLETLPKRKIHLKFVILVTFGVFFFCNLRPGERERWMWPLEPRCPCSYSG